MLPPIHRASRLRSLAALLLATSVLLLAVLQYRWLDRLRIEEEARRRVALDVATATFDERFTARLAERLAVLGPDAAPAGAIAWEPARGRGRVRDEGAWRPASVVELRRLPGPALLDRPGASRAGLWLDPPLLHRCEGDRCVGLPLAAEELSSLVATLMDRTFADFGPELELRLVLSEGETLERVVHGAPRGPASVDERRPVAVALTTGPDDHHWVLEVSHAGSSLGELVRRTHRRNLLASGSVLLLLGLGLWLSFRSARRELELAAQQVQFVASASHELRSPLAVIDAAADNLAAGATTDAARVREYGRLIRGEARRLGALVENVLQFSASACRPLSVVELDLTTVLEAAVADLHRGATAGDAERAIEIRLDPDLPPVGGDERALRALLINLLANALRHAGGDGPVRVAASRTTLPRGRPGVALTVTNPVGTRVEADPERWFEPFRRGRAALDRGTPGTGLGLTVARNIARQHGGALAARVAPGVLARFTLYLPLAGAPGRRA